MNTLKELALLIWSRLNRKYETIKLQKKLIDALRAHIKVQDDEAAFLRQLHSIDRQNINFLVEKFLMSELERQIEDINRNKIPPVCPN